MNKYNTGTYRGNIPKIQAHKVALLWGEGSLELTDFLEFCIKNDIKTKGSCKGHTEVETKGEWANPYIAFMGVPKDFVEHMVAFIESDDALLYITSTSISTCPSIFKGVDFSIYGRTVEIDEDSPYMFKKLLKGLQEYKAKELRKPSSISQSVIDKVYQDQNQEHSENPLGWVNVHRDRPPYPEIEEKPINEIEPSIFKNFCMSSKRTISQIIERGKAFISKAMKRENVKDTKYKGEEK